MRFLSSRNFALALGLLSLGMLVLGIQGLEARDKGKASSEIAMFGGSPARNMVDLVEKGIPDDWSVAKGKEKNLKWSATLGTAAYGGPVIAGDRIFMGTNNDRPRDPAIKGDKGILMCFRLSDGKFLWQAVHDKLPDPDANDWPKQGIASTPCIDGDRLYYVSNRAELVCADVVGDEATGKAKILWSLDMIKDLNVYPCYLANCSPLILGDLVYAITGNGTDHSTGKAPSPKAASFVAVDKKSGKVVWQSNLPGEQIMRGAWSNPAAAMVDGKWQVIFPGADGWLYGLDAKNGELIWKFDCNPKKAKPYRPGGGGQKSFPIATPVVHDNKVYLGVGQEPDDGPGVGHLWCIDLTKKPKNKELDLSPVNDNFDPAAPENKDSGLVWHYGGPILPKPMDGPEYHFGRTISTVAVVDGLVYAAEIAGYLHCLDAKTGKRYWVHDFQENTWSSPYYVDGNVYLGTSVGDVLIYEHGKTFKEPKKVPMGRPVHTAPATKNGVLYVNNGIGLYAITK